MSKSFDAADVSDQLDLARDRVPETCRAVGVDPESAVGEVAAALARRHHGPAVEDPLDMAPSSIAAGAVYLAAMLEVGVPKITQTELSDAAGVHPRTITKAWRQLARREGYDVAAPGETTTDTGRPQAGRVQRLTGRALARLREVFGR
jgi:hypothetical protein